MQSPPKAPSYHPMSYVGPAPFASAQNYATVPNVLSGPKIAKQANETMANGPAWLNLNNYNNTSNPSAPGQHGGPFDQTLMKQMSNWYMQNQVQPQVSAAQSQAQSNGQNYGSYAPAMAGQITGQGQQSAFQAALAANQAEFNNVLGGNNAFYNGPAHLGAQQNDAAAQAQLQAQGLMNDVSMFNAGQQNNYSLRSADMANNFNLNPNQNPNSFNLQNFGNQMASYNANPFGGGLGNTLGMIF